MLKCHSYRSSQKSTADPSCTAHILVPSELRDTRCFWPVIEKTEAEEKDRSRPTGSSRLKILGVAVVGATVCSCCELGTGLHATSATDSKKGRRELSQNHARSLTFPQSPTASPHSQSNHLGIAILRICSVYKHNFAGRNCCRKSVPQRPLSLHLQTNPYT